MSPAELKALQQRLGTTNRRLAELLGVTEGAVEHWRLGRRPVPGPVALAVALMAALKEGKLDEAVALASGSM